MPPPPLGPGPSAAAAKGAAASDEILSDSEDSDYYHPEQEYPPSAPPIISDFVSVAKLYGYETAPPPSFALEWDRRYAALFPDGSLWHSDDFDESQPAGWIGEVGRLDLANVTQVSLSPSGKELVLSQTGKCHLIATHQESRTTVAQWVEAFNTA